ncbi:MAG: GntR family transcriptional regulator [Actinomycetota bacterium]|jgi:GntR family transcriptional regulator|nr:GntR family transcriptional regulator [Actinomycetota bacterium]
MPGAPAPRGTIRKGSPLPYYAQLAAILRKAISDGDWPPGFALPSEADLCAMFGLSRTAVRQALAELSAEGLVHKEKGRGSFVRGPRTGFVVQEIRGFFEEMREQGRSVSTEVLDLRTVVAEPDYAALLDVPTGSELIRLERLRSAEGEAILLVETLLPSPRFKTILDEDLTTVSLYDHLREVYDVVPRGGHRLVEAVAAERRTARLLGVRAGSPLLRLRSVNVDQDGQPFEAFTAWYRADRASFQISVSPT